MLSKNNIKLIKSLAQKKYRKEHNLFTIEGDKMVIELINSSIQIKNVYATDTFNQRIKNKIAPEKLSLISDKELKQISQLSTPNQVLAVAHIPQENFTESPVNGLSIALDNIQDPGNLGTIIRTANWFGVKTIYCSPNCVDAYNQKVVQSTMGAVFDAEIIYTDLSKLFKQAKAKSIPIYGTTLSGENLYEKSLHKDALLVMGNESKGLSEELKSMVDQEIYIPPYPANSETHIESLNVAIATSIILAEFRRR